MGLTCCGEKLDGLKRSAAAIERHRLRNEQAQVFARAFTPFMAQETDAIRQAVRRSFGTRDTSSFFDWLDEFYPQHEERLNEEFDPLVLLYGRRISELTAEELGLDTPVDSELFGHRYAQALAARWARRSDARLRRVVDETDDDVADALLEKADQWEETRASQIAEQEATQGAAAFAKHSYLIAGVGALRWRAIGDSCPLCSNLNGKTVNITSSFLSEGDELNAGDRTLRASVNIGHPPLHDGCDCIVSPSFT